MPEPSQPVVEMPSPEQEPEPMVAEEQVYDPDDLETPAYLRQGRMIN